MPIETGREKGTASVHIDHDRCTVCGLCAAVCRGAPLYVQEGRVCVDQSRLFGCLACGQCVSVCPTGAITVEGRAMSRGRTSSRCPPDTSGHLGTRKK